MAAAQLGGMSYLIFVKYSWDVMEPISYMISAFYACVGSLYYLLYKSDFEMGSAYYLFRQRKLMRLMKKNRFDEKKIEFLEEYVATLKEQIGTLKNEAS